MCLMNTTNTSVINAAVIRNDLGGLVLEDNTRNDCIANTTAMCNGYNGMYLQVITKLNISSLQF